MQEVSFRSVEEMLECLPDEERKITLLLRKIILSTVPEVTEKLSFNVPFYKLHANFCFIWPGSVAWGSMTQPGVRLGFTKGYLMADAEQWLEKGNRKQVYWKDFLTVKEVNPDGVRWYIQEAVLLDETLWRNKKKN